mmetsp:Transcript_6136/g.18684  ORF Transcript_6136/g.18684 Transcript_6136/m.18684 type:complete len:259 (+) Transcript_6136:37-813(+)
MSDTDDLVWYASYGSNIRLERFLCYLQGGTPEGGFVHCPGARDRSAPREALPIRFLRLPMYFAQFGRRWKGAVAFVDIDQSATFTAAEEHDRCVVAPRFEVVPSSAASDSSSAARSSSTAEFTRADTFGRMYLITREQFNDLVAQENFVPDFALDLNELKETREHMHNCFPSHWYGVVLYLGEHAGQPVLSFTGHNPAEERALRPSMNYLRTIASGLYQTYEPLGWTRQQVAAYLYARQAVQQHYPEFEAFAAELKEW